MTMTDEGAPRPMSEQKQAMPPELLPCPFCGERAEIWRAHEGRTAWIACMGKCSVLVSKEYKTDADAIAAWNRRATPTALAAYPAVKALVAEAEARGMERAAERLDLAEHDAEERDWRSGANAFATLAKGFRAEAAAIRKGETP